MFNVRWGMCTGRIAGFQVTMMGGTGHCGSSLCLDAMTPPKSSMKSMSAKRHTRMLTSAAWPLTTSTRVSACLLSFKNPRALAPKASEAISVLSEEERT